MTFLLIIMTYSSSLVSQFFVKSQPYKVNPKISDFVYEAKNLDLSLYECNFSKSMQDTKRKFHSLLLKVLQIQIW